MDERERWDQRHAFDEEDRDPDSIVREASKLIPAGRALDLACGTGRNALYLARSGWSVLAVDYSASALEKVRQRTVADGVQIESLLEDLTDWALPTDSFDLICDCRYLQRDLFPRIESALKPGGIFVAVIAIQGHMRPEYLLSPGELPTLLPRLRVIRYSEAKMAELIAIRDI